MSMAKPTLSVEGLSTYYFTREGVVKAVDNVSLQVDNGSVVGVVGESGSGKSALAASILQLIDPPGKIVEGRIIFLDRDLVQLDHNAMRTIRGAGIGTIFQDPMTALNPVLRIDTQMTEAIHAHEHIPHSLARQRAEKGLTRVGIASAAERLLSYPHQLSGGTRQRVAIAIAMLNEPKLLIADEPTTALDVTIQAQVLFEVQRLRREAGTSILWITHDFSVVAAIADFICVMYRGKIVEQGPSDSVLDKPRHPYTVGLMRSIPNRNPRGRPLFQMKGESRSVLERSTGCVFRSRCWRADSQCDVTPPTVEYDSRHLVQCFYPMDESEVDHGSIRANC